MDETPTEFPVEGDNHVSDDPRSSLSEALNVAYTANTLVNQGYNSSYAIKVAPSYEPNGDWAF